MDSGIDDIVRESASDVTKVGSRGQKKLQAKINRPGGETFLNYEGFADLDLKPGGKVPTQDVVDTVIRRILKSDNLVIKETNKGKFKVKVGGSKGPGIILNSDFTFDTFAN